MKLSNNLHVTDKMNGKMKGFASLSSNSNSFCEKMSKVQGSVCQKCYANRMKKLYESLNKVLDKNDQILNSKDLTQWNLTNYAYFRLQAFGDCSSQKVVNNYFNFVEANPQTTFALWTKRPDMINKVIAKRGKPANLILVRSSIMINKPANLPKNFDKVFTVYDKETSKKVNINCGAKSCLNCRLCYTHNDTVYVNEVLK